ncbi:MAG: hypothetical protein GXO14_01140 [Thermococci archaeon]|nr:hypothetical protein [Thermococci archaeon]
MSAKNIAYWTAVTVAAMSLFLPLLAPQIPALKRLMGSYSPLKSAAVLLVSIVAAYFLSGEQTPS